MIANSLFVSFFSGIYSNFSKVYKRSAIVKKIDAFFSGLERSFENCMPMKLIDWLFNAIKKSRIGKWFVKEEEEEVEIFSSSKTVNFGVETVETGIEKSQKYAKGSFGFEFLNNLYSYFFSKPVFVVSLVVFFAALTNTILWLFLREFEMFGFVIRMIILFISFLGLFVRLDMKKLRG